MRSGDPDFSFETSRIENGKLIAETSDGREFKIRYGDKANTIETRTTSAGNTYTVGYNGDALPDFTPYAVKDALGNPIS
ncbi:hypothetical protein [Mechercharimyces sp. CAU 1602]|uniref:hypothetical protein n=1 Tax=Mechercharimyces sp. CAU 1602 TaxID=2973933 RepID=UPI002162183E|nr:hypothetical protein [Mechercharimyces sp. CAU 1602]MCS1351668.1 hypothetical protein [Mechercharimyces sp. CAU 1602]